MRGWSIWALITIGVVIICVTCSLAGAQDRGAWFKSLKQPGTGVSCCDVSDCKRTDARWQAGSWWAVQVMGPGKGQLISVPREREVRNVPTIDGEAYLCQSATGRIYCFVPPSPGS